jgi:hypothetical protein
VPHKVRETVAVVRRLAGAAGRTVKTGQLARELGLDTSSVRRRVTEAVEAGYLIDRGRARARELVVGDPLPEDRQALPTPVELAAACTRACTPEGAH